MPSDTNDADRQLADARATATTTPNETGTGSQANDRSETDGRSAAGNRNTTDGRAVTQRLRAVERAITGSNASIPDIADDATATVEREAIESRLDDLESRVEELEAATQAIRGYVGSIRAVNREVERRADLALARASDGAEAAEANYQAATSDDSERRDNATAADEPIESVPSDAALNAALPSDRRCESGGEGAATGSMSWRADRDSLDRKADTDGSWRDDALARLRESL